MKAFIRWVLGEIWEKINFPAIYKEIKALGRKHGRRFFWTAIIWELIEDVVFPVISWVLGMPELIPLFLVLHFEPIAYPAIFWMFRTYDRIRGREPWEPDRSAQSSYWRSMLKVMLYKIAIVGWFVAIMLGLHLSPLSIIFYAMLTSMFGFIHERIWADSNYGIRDNDTVEMKRNVAKACTYRVVSIMIMYPLLRALIGTVPWHAIAACQAIGFIIYVVLETVWSKSGWGVSETKHVDEISA